MELPREIDELTPEYLSGVAGKLFGDDSVRVTTFEVRPEPFAYPKFGDKKFDEIAFEYEGPGGGGRSTLILRRLPPNDAVMALTGDTEHRELRAFQRGLYQQMPAEFHIPYVDVILDDDRQQYWIFVEDVREDMERLGMTGVIPDPTLRVILSHLAAFHARFWEREELLSQPWLMRLERPVDYFYPIVVDVLDGLARPSEHTRYVLSQWPWLQEGIVNLMESLRPDTRKLVEDLFRHPERLLELVRDMPRTLCHYDFDNRNLGIRPTADGGFRTVVIDWEILGEGLCQADVCRFLAYQQPPNMSELLDHYLNELERLLGHPIDRRQWHKGFELVTIASWQIIGFEFAAIINTPNSPVPDALREGLRPRVYNDIDAVEQLARKWLT